MPKYTEEQLVSHEQFDEDIYVSTRCGFEIVLDSLLEAAKSGDEAKTDSLRGIVLRSYNSSSEGSQRLMGLLRRAENG